MSIDQIADVAVAVADAEGIEGASMQRVADDLGVTKMSLYRYVAGKSELVAIMVERAVGDPPDLSRVAGGWRPRLERWLRGISMTWDEHQWLPWATVGSRVIGPREAGWTEAAVAALDDTSLSHAQRMDVVSTLSGLLRNTQSGLVAGTQPWHDANLTELMRENADRFPNLSRATRARPRSPRKAREFGLRCLLDGVELQIERTS
jgi:AcrR family transcriptional regulator